MVNQTSDQVQWVCPISPHEQQSCLLHQSTSSHAKLSYEITSTLTHLLLSTSSCHEQMTAKLLHWSHAEITIKKQAAVQKQSSFSPVIHTNQHDNLKVSQFHFVKMSCSHWLLEGLRQLKSPFTY